MRAQAATKAVEEAVRVGFTEIDPACDTRSFGVASDELVSERESCLFAAVFVAFTDSVSLAVGHKRQVVGAGEGPLCVFDGSSNVDERCVLNKDFSKVSE